MTLPRLAAPPAAPPAVPLATYRLQLHGALTFRQAAKLAPYLRALGITHCYASPVLQARSGSTHGYDGVDPTALSAELGGDAGFAVWDAALRRAGLGLLLDIVPNHLCVDGDENPWWNDVLTHGRGSPHAAAFDIDWESDDDTLQGRVLLPVLGGDPQALLAAGELRLRVEQGFPRLAYFHHRWPLAPASWHLLLAPLCRAPAVSADTRKRLRGLLTRLRAFRPPWRLRRPLPRQLLRELERTRARLEALVGEDPALSAALEAELAVLQAEAATDGAAHGLGRWPALLEAQAWRLADWRQGSARLNYRRFFDVTELAALRQEQPAVFRATHARVLALMAQGSVQGFRVDHPDGLTHPAAYLRRLRHAMRGALGEARAGLPGSSGAIARHSPARQGYLVIEKILDPGERRRGDWPVDGGTGYDLLYRLNAVQVDLHNAPAFRAAYARLTGDAESFADHVREGKLRMLATSLEPDLRRLTRQLLALAAQAPGGIALEQGSAPAGSATLNAAAARAALIALVVSLPVYRTFVADGGPAAPEDAQWISAALAEARRRHGELDPALLDWLGRLWLHPAQTLPAASPSLRRAAQAFVSRLQQLTAATMARGMEDTAFYRYVPLTSLNEVGGDPGAFGVSRAAFHAWNRSRARRWPRALSATATHDTKRGEGVRARLNALSEIPEAWEQAVTQWRASNSAHHMFVGSLSVPDPPMEYLIYQTLVGTWPLAGPQDEDWGGYAERIAAYVRKAAREAKRRTSWTDPDAPYEAALERFVLGILAPDPQGPFLAAMARFVAPVQRAGLYNALTQTLFKIALPGVPDFYQGTELWDFSLVDPDNRRPVDFERRRALLAGLPREASPRAAAALLEGAQDGRIKLYLIREGLRLRARRATVFTQGAYRALETSGARERHVIAFARSWGGAGVVAVGTRLFLGLPGGSGPPLRPPLGEPVWADTTLDGLPAGVYRDVLTGRTHRPRRTPGHAGRWSLPVADVLAHLPLALLERTA